MRGLPGTITRSVAPVVSLTNNTFCHVLPPSALRNTPRSGFGAHVGIGGIDHDPGDLSDIAEAHELPALARVGRHEDAAAVHDVVPRVLFSGADPHDVRVRGRERDGTDRRRRLVLEHRLPRIAAVGRLPYAAGRRADVVQVAVSGDAHDGGNTAARHRGAEVAEPG